MNEEEKKEFKRIKKQSQEAWLDDDDIKFLVNSIEKLPKENEELKEIYRSEKNMKNEYIKLYQDLLLKENVIPTQKVKDKIEEIINNREYKIVFEGDADFPDDATTIEVQKYIKLDKLQELIEEREEHQMTDKQEKAIEKIKRRIALGKCEKNIGIPVYISELETVLSILEEKDKMIDLMSEQLTTPIHSKEWVKEYYDRKAKETE